MRRYIVPTICLLLVTFCFFNYNSIVNYIINKISFNNKLIIKDGNDYEKKYNFNYVQNTSEFVPYSKQDLLNIFFTAINKGWTKFTFYCPKEYELCLKDVDTLTDNSNILSDLNNFVHPYNSVSKVTTPISSSGEITLDITYVYTKEQIDLINTKVNELIKSTYNEELSDYENIKNIHDEIINNTKYDVERNKNGSSDYLSYIAYGPLYQGYATCNGYTDLMAIILSELGFKNFKVSTNPNVLTEEETGHIWNAVYVNDSWVHLDLTWDDPVSKDGKDYLYHTYFLVKTDALEKADSGQVIMNEHKFDKSIYTELKN